MAVSRADLVELFGEEHLVTVRPAALAGLGLDPTAVRVLTEIGLPDAPARGLPPDVPPLLVVTPPQPAGRYVRIGRLMGDAADACVTPETGAVVGLFPGEVFVSSDLDRFVETLYLVNRMNAEHVDADDDEFQRAADELYERLAVLDPPAMAGDAWWASVVQEMQLGLM
ncbi:SUKH-4 family immunity protein [Micromonospora sp. CPCC 205371]|nr:SUKH-4 family immunity protein [Micromonospora sp. CPCC 205371]